VRDRALLVERDRREEPLELETAPRRDLVHEPPTALRERDLDAAAVPRAGASRDEALAHEAIAHPARGRRLHGERIRELCQVARAARREHDERPVLRHRDLLAGAGERPGGDRDERTTGAHHRVDRGALGRRGLGCVAVGGGRGRLRDAPLDLRFHVLLLGDRPSDGDPPDRVHRLTIAQCT